MTFQPVVPFGGLSGWAFLERTREAQQEAFDNSGPNKRETEYFLEKIASVQTPEDLMEDRRLLSVALGAFGLSEDINSTFFVRKVLEEGTLDETALANRLSDTRYFALAEAFGFDLDPPNTGLSEFGANIASAYLERSFEAAVGEQSSSMRLVLSLDRELDELIGRDLSEDGAWFTVMATPPLRSVFESAFRLPVSVGALDIDRQLEIFKEKASAFFGSESIAQFADPDRRGELARLYLATSELQAAPPSTVRGSSALALLQSFAPQGLF